MTQFRIGDVVVHSEDNGYKWDHGVIFGVIFQAEPGDYADFIVYVLYNGWSGNSRGLGFTGGYNTASLEESWVSYKDFKEKYDKIQNR